MFNNCNITKINFLLHPLTYKGPLAQSRLHNMDWMPMHGYPAHINKI